MFYIYIFIYLYFIDFLSIFNKYDISMHLQFNGVLRLITVMQLQILAKE